MDGREHFVVFDGVCKYYQMGETRIAAADHITFHIDEGEFCVIVGPSGAGKTTVLNMLGGMDSCTSGLILVDGARVSDYNAKQLTGYRRHDIGFVFQFYNLVQNLTALENVELAAQICRDPLPARDVLVHVGLADRLDTLPGIGPARAKGLEKLGLVTVEDLLRDYPRSYEDRRRFSTVAAAPVDIPVCLELLVAEPPRLSRIRKGLELVKARLVDDTGSLTATFFNQSYLKNALRGGETYVCFGRVEGTSNRKQMTNPVCERADRARFTGCILPVYPLTKGISNNLMAALARRCVEGCAGQVEETLPQALLIFNIPFTLVKAACDVAITFAVYKRISPLIHGQGKRLQA